MRIKRSAPGTFLYGTVCTQLIAAGPSRAPIARTDRAQHRRSSVRAQHVLLTGAGVHAAFTSAQGFGDLEQLDLRDNSLPDKSAAIDKLRQRFGAAAIGPGTLSSLFSIS